MCLVVLHSRTSGVIEAAAAVRCGGRAFLTDAIAKGEVKVSEHNGVKVFFLPKVVFEKENELSKLQQGTRSKEAAKGTAKELTQIADSMSFGFISSSASSATASLMDGLTMSEADRTSNVKHAFVHKFTAAF